MVKLSKTFGFLSQLIMQAVRVLSLFIRIFASSVELADLFTGLAEPARAQGGPALRFVFGQQPFDDVFDFRKQLAVSGEVGDFHVDLVPVWPGRGVRPSHVGQGRAPFGFRGRVPLGSPKSWRYF